MWKKVCKQARDLKSVLEAMPAPGNHFEAAPAIS
jgi:hypothetical protein